MKVKFLVALTLFALLASIISGCASTSTTTGATTTAATTTAGSTTTTATTTATSGEKIKVGVSLPTLQEERWQNDNNYFKEEAAKMGNVDLLVQIADNDADKQFSQVENLITQGIKVLIIGAVDTSTIGPAVQKAHDAGIKVIAYCRLIKNADYDLLTLFDQYQDQQLAVEYALSLAPKGNYVLLAPDQTTQPEATEFKNAWYDALQPLIDKGDIKIVLDQYCKNWAPEEGMANMENALTKANGDIAAVLCANDGIASGAIQALTAQGLAGKVIVTGNDSDLNALKRIVAGTQTSTIYQNTRNQVIATLDAAVKLFNGEKIETNKVYNNDKIDVPALQIENQLVTKDTLDKVIIDSGRRTHEEIYGN